MYLNDDKLNYLMDTIKRRLMGKVYAALVSAFFLGLALGYAWRMAQC